MKGQYKTKFTEENIITALTGEHAIMRKGIADKVKCNERTVENLLKPLVESGRVIKRNLGTEKKPTYVYYLAIEEIDASEHLQSCGMDE